MGVRILSKPLYLPLEWYFQLYHILKKDYHTSHSIDFVPRKLNRTNRRHHLWTFRHLKFHILRNCRNFSKLWMVMVFWSRKCLKEFIITCWKRAENALLVKSLQIWTKTAHSNNFKSDQNCNLVIINSGEKLTRFPSEISDHMPYYSFDRF